MAKITFIYPDLSYFDDKRDWPGTMSLGLAYVSSSAREAGHTPSLIHVVSEPDREEILGRIEELQPDVVGFSAMSHHHDTVTRIAGWIRERFDIPVLYGGVHPTIDPEGCINAPEIDMICIGEGERPLIELLDRIDRGEDTTGVHGIWTKSGGEIHRNPVANLVENLDEFPYPDRDLFDFTELWDYKERYILVFATRGCPYKCTYCINHQYRKIYPNYKKYVRFRSPERVVDEIRQVKESYPEMQYVGFLDDAFCIRKDWLREFLPMYKREIGMPFLSNTSIKLLDEEVISMCVDAGAIEFGVGIESGNYDIRADVLKRRMTNEKIIETYALARKYGLKMSTYNMVGIPHETLFNTLETVKLNAQVYTPSQHVAILQPYKYTEIYDLCREEGYLKEEGISSFFRDSVLDLPTITRNEILFAYKYFMIFVKLYKFAYAVPVKKISSILEKLFDWYYLNKSLKKFQLLTYPILFLLVRPVKFARIYTYKYCPNLGYRIKWLFIKLKIIKGKA